MESPIYFCSWSGGKDSCLALHYALRSGKSVATLLTMMEERGERSRSHGLPLSVLQRQAQLLGIPLERCATTWQNYEQDFIRTLVMLKGQLQITGGIFGDIDLEDHRLWVERVCQGIGLSPWLPLWQKRREDLLRELLQLGFVAEIVAVQENLLPAEYLGRVIDGQVLKEFSQRGIDLAGEKGEYHTVITDGPLFSAPLNLQRNGPVLMNGVWFSQVSLAT